MEAQEIHVQTITHDYHASVMCQNTASCAQNNIAVHNAQYTMYVHVHV